ncbi:MAG: hypothetical protein IJ499_00545, partial [Clostridia bacterium]|nr:hypothetical protein [Clostridia bacterium]
MLAVLPLISLLVIIGVFWWLKLVGITLAGDAFCGFTEHTHTESCYEAQLICVDEQDEHTHTDSCYESVLICQTEEHTHISECYSDITADLETADDWEETLMGIPNGLSTSETVVEIAESQLGYTESILNFVVDTDGLRHGYTRYGEWYGNPYGDWSNMFTAFCLRYGGLLDIPISAGADAFRQMWQELDLYIEADAYSPFNGDIVFLDKNLNGTPDTTAVIIQCDEHTITVIEGDLNDTVAENTYTVGDAVICGYGMTSPSNNLLLLEPDTDSSFIANTVEYNSNLFVSGNNFVVYTEKDSKYYAMDGNGYPVEIFIDSKGNITSNVSDPNLLLWTFTSANNWNAYNIRNVRTGRYMHAYMGNPSSVTTSGAYSSNVITMSGGIKIQSNSEYAMLNSNNTAFQVTSSQNDAALYNLGVNSSRTVWLDGTNGGLYQYSASLDKSYTVNLGETVVLPDTWQSP